MEEQRERNIKIYKEKTNKNKKERKTYQQLADEYKVTVWRIVQIVKDVRKKLKEKKISRLEVM